MPMQDKGFGRGGKGKDNYGYGQWWPQQQQWPPQQQWGRYQQWPPYKGDKGAGRGGKDKGKDKGNKGMAADQVQSLKEKAKAAQAEYKQAKDAAEYGDGYPRQHPPPQRPSTSSGHTGGHTEADTEAYWSMYDGGSGGPDHMHGVSEKTSRANPPVTGKEKNRLISRRLEALGSMHDREKLLHAYLYVPDGYELSLICVDSGCTVTNIDHA